MYLIRYIKISLFSIFYHPKGWNLLINALFSSVSVCLYFSVVEIHRCPAISCTISNGNFYSLSQFAITLNRIVFGFKTRPGKSGLNCSTRKPTSQPEIGVPRTPMMIIGMRSGVCAVGCVAVKLLAEFAVGNYNQYVRKMIYEFVFFSARMSGIGSPEMHRDKLLRR